ncbi:EamA-like transporter family protein [Buchnera aphidicola (Tetraneura ulmi)]|uniref:DMT family transporter n=1 Tax=Buchnera aphidicola TaxID=9 RepID=UPI003463996D
MKKIFIFLLFISVTIILGTTWLAMKIALQTIPPLFITGVRFLISFTLLTIISFFFKAKLFFPVRKLQFQILLSIFYFLIPFTLMLYCGKFLEISLSAIIYSNMPVIILFFSSILEKKNICFLKKIGIFFSILSLISIFVEKIFFGSIQEIFGIIALLIAMFSHSIIYIKSKKELSNFSVITLNALPSFLSGIILIIGSFFFENPNIMFFSKSSILATIYLGSIVGVFGILSYFYLQKKTNPLIASMVFLFFPLIPIGTEYFFHNKFLLKIELFSVFFSFFGIMIILFSSFFLI